MLPSNAQPANVPPSCIELHLSEKRVRHLKEREEDLSKSLFPPARCFFKSASIVQINHSELSIRKLISCRLLKYLNKAVPDDPVPMDTQTLNNVELQISKSSMQVSNQREPGALQPRRDHRQQTPMGGETLRVARPTEQIERKPSARGRIAPSLRMSKFCQEDGVPPSEPASTSTLAKLPPRRCVPEMTQVQNCAISNSSNKTLVHMEPASHASTSSEMKVDEPQIGSIEPRIGSVVVRGVRAASVTKEQMTGKFLYSCAALSDIREGTELQHRVWGVLLSQHARRVLIIGPPGSGKRKAYMSIAAQAQRSGTVVIVAYGKKRVEEVINTIGFVPSVTVKPHWRGSDANILVGYPGWLRLFAQKLPKVAMMVVDRFDQLVDWGLERLILEAAAKLPPEVYLIATARAPSQRLFELADRLRLTAQIEVVGKMVPEEQIAGRCYKHEIIEFSGSRRQAIQNLLDPIEHGTKLIVLFAKSAKEGNQLSESLEDQGICDAWPFHSPLEEVRIMSKEHLAYKQCALYIAVNNDHECLAIVKGFVDIVINMRPAECDQVTAFRSSLLKPGGTMFTLKRTSDTGSSKGKTNESQEIASTPNEEMLLKALTLLLEFGSRL